MPPHLLEAPADLLKRLVGVCAADASCCAPELDALSRTQTLLTMMIPIMLQRLHRTATPSIIVIVIMFLLRCLNWLLA